MAENGIGAVGTLIRQYRIIAELTQKQLAERCGINESTIRNYELGNRYPDSETLAKIAAELGVSYYTLADPNPYDVTGALHVLFDLERYYGLCPEMKNGKTIFSFGEKPEWAVPTDPKDTEMLKIMTEKWIQVRDELKSGAITDDDYFMWESRYPENAVTQKPINDSRKRKKPKDK